MRRPIDDEIRQLGWAEPPVELRARILADASVGAVNIAWSDRVWFSRTFRWSVAAGIISMIAINVAGGTKSAGAAALQSADSIATAQAIENSVTEIGLPADFAKSLAQRAVVARAAATKQSIQIDGGGDR